MYTIFVDVVHFSLVPLPLSPVYYEGYVHEAYLPTEKKETYPHTRFSGPNGNARRPQGTVTPPTDWQKKTDSIIPLVLFVLFVSFVLY